MTRKAPHAVRDGSGSEQSERVATPLSLTEAAQMDDLIDALASCIVGCQGRTNRDRALAVLAVIEEQGWKLTPPKEEE